MPIPLDALVGELNITAGVRQSTTPASEVFTAPRRAARGRASDTLYVLIDLSGDSSSGLLADIGRRMSSAYWSTPGSVTAALRAAINAGSDFLMSRNLDSPAAERQYGGVSCIVLRAADIYIAQAGLANAYVAHQGSLEQFPARDSEPPTPIGMTRSAEIRFAHEELQPGDVVVLTDPRAPARVPIESVARAIVYVGVQQALLNLAQLAGSGDLAALVLEAVPTAEAAAATEATTTPASTPIIRSAASTSSATQPAEPARASTPIIRSAASTPKSTTAAQPDRSAAPKPQPAPKGVLRGNAMRTWLSAIGQGLKRGAGSVGAAGQAMLQRTLPDSTAAAPRRRTRAVSDLEKNTPVMAGIAIGIPIIVALLVVTIYIQRSTQAEVNALLIETQNEVTAALSATGPAARNHWENALDRAGQAAKLAPDNQTAHDQLARAQAELDRIDNVVRLTPTSLWDFKSSGPFRLATQAFSLFVLDRANNQVDRITLNTAGDGIEGNGPAPVLRPGTSINGKIPGDLLDIAWMDSSEARQANSLMILHRGGLVEFNLSFGLKPIDFGDNTVPAGAKRLRAFIGNLYLLDTGASQIWRYTPNGDSYAGQPEGFFTQLNSDVAKAIDMAIDGSIYVLGSDGQIHKYLRGEPQDFNLTGLTEPLRQPTAIAVDANVATSSLYVTDKWLGRIVQLRPDGQFVRQFRANGPAFDAIDDLLIDEQNSRLFVISSQGVLYTAQMPSLGGQP